MIKYSCLGLWFLSPVIKVKVKKIKMFRFLPIISVFFIVLLYSSSVLADDALANGVVHHKLDVQIDPLTATLIVEDTITLPSTADADRLVSFLLHRNLKIGTTSNIIQTHQEIGVAFAKTAQKARVPLKQYSIQVNKGQRQISLKYRGNIAHNVGPSEQEYARSFSETPGLIDAEGVFLARSTAWFPQFKQDDLLSFNLNVQLPEPWDAVSQGVRTAHTVENGVRQVVWDEVLPQDDIYLIAGQYKEYSQGVGAATAMVFMREGDDVLAQKYLDVTGQYIAMYSRLIGPYPYKKFALVENFWETGYGMPSFTLLGPKVMRFPFIMHSSYPHEILHNWWGNGVFVNYDKGNWAEGLTAYLADHLIKEQRGQGAQHRRNVLQKYTDFVSEGQDFPLTDFVSRHSSATEAVGYGKTLMFFHMLRQTLGDAGFTKSLAHFYRRYNGKIAGFNEIESVMSDVLEMDLQPEFEQWVTRTGAPNLNLLAASVSRDDDHYQLSFTIEQTQLGVPYRLSVPIAVHLQEQAEAHQLSVSMTKRQQKFSVTLPERPYRLDIDPEFDVFRRLHSAEIPAALSQGFGAEQVLVLLPSMADEAMQSAYRQLAQRWQRSQAGAWEIKLDSDVEVLPTDKTVWLLGWRNRFKSAVYEALAAHQVEGAAAKVVIANDADRRREFERAKHSVLLAARNPQNTAQTLLWLGSDNVDAMPGLARKLPHYRKYSYLAFEGDEPNNIEKGQWSTANSPMTIMFKQNNGDKKVTGARYAARQALAQLPAAYSQARLLADVEYLAGDELEGRGIGTVGLDKAAAYIAEQFRQAGLTPGGDGSVGKTAPGQAIGDYFQTWKEDIGHAEGVSTLTNVIGVLPGKNPAYHGQSVIVSAHYDHLGRGWPDVHQGDEGKIHFGADDNASGVAVMLELARSVAKKWQPERTIVFIAFTAEESRHRGSIHYINHSGDYPTEQVIGVVNLDTVGRLGEQPVTVFGTGSASEWVHIFRGIGFVTGIPIRSIANDFGSSDQKSFLDVGIPAVQLFATAHEDFHRPGDRIEKIDAAGLIKITSVLSEAMEYLSNRPEALHSNLTAADASKQQAVAAGSSAKSSQGRRVSLGTVPDFAYQGEGVKITGTVPASPAAMAGLMANDVLIELAGKKIKDLGGFSNIMKSLQAGDTTELIFLRDGNVNRVKLNVAPR